MLWPSFEEAAAANSTQSTTLNKILLCEILLPACFSGHASKRSIHLLIEHFTTETRVGAVPVHTLRGSVFEAHSFLYHAALQLKAQTPSRTCNESKEEGEE